MLNLKVLVTTLAIAAGMAISPPVAAQNSDWTASDALKPCFESGEGEDGAAQALAKCRELLGSARYGGEDAAMLRFAIIEYQSRTATVDEQIEQLTLLTRESLPANARYDRDEWLGRLCYNAQKWACVVDALKPDLESADLTVDGLSMFTEAMIEAQGAGPVQSLGEGLIQKSDGSAVGYLVRAEGRGKAGDRVGAITDLIAAGERLPQGSAKGHNTVCWRLVTELSAASEARTSCDKAAAGAPLDWMVWDSHGAMNLALGDFARAWQDYEQAVRLDESAAHALYGRGLALEGLGNVADGKKDKDAALAKDPTLARTYAGYKLDEQRRSPPKPVVATQPPAQPKQVSAPPQQARSATPTVAQSPRTAAAPETRAPAQISERELELRAYLAKLPQAQLGRMVTIDKSNSKRVPHGLWGSKFDDYEYEVRLTGKKGERYRVSLSSLRNGEIPTFAFGGSLKAPLLRLDATIVDSATKQGRSAFAKYSTDFIVFEIPETGDYVLTLSQSGTVTKSSGGAVGGMSPQGNKNPDAYRMKIERVR